MYQFDTTAADASWQWRINMSADGSVTRLGMYVDDVRIRYVVTPAPTITLDALDTMERRWSDSFNWSPRSVPTATTDVVINGMFQRPDLTTITPLLNAAGACLSLQVGETAASTLDLTGANNLTVAGGVTIETNGTVTDPGDTGTVFVAGSWSRNGSGVFTAGTTTVEFNGSGAIDQTVIGTMTGANAFNNLTVNRGAGVGVAALQSNVAINGTLQVSAGTLNLVSVDGLSHTAGTLSMTSGGLTFAGANDGALTVSGATTLSGGALTMDTSGASPDLLDLNGGLTFGGSFELTGSITGGEIRVASAASPVWNDTPSTGVVDPTGGTIQLDPTVVTTYGITAKASTRFNNLVLAGGSNGVVFNPDQNLVIDGNLTLNGGTFSWDDTLAPTSGTRAHSVAGTFTQSGGLMATNRQAGVGSTLTVTGAVSVTSGSFDNANSAGSVTVGSSDELIAGANVTVTATAWECGTALRIDDIAPAGAHALSMASGSMVKYLKLTADGEAYNVTTANAYCGFCVLSSGTLTVGGTSPSFNCGAAPGGGWPGGDPPFAFRFSGATPPANRVLTVSAGTFTTSATGAFNDSGGNGTVNLSAGTLTVGTGGFNFPDSLDFAISLTGGTLQCAGGWQVEDSADADLPTWSMTTSTVEWNGTAAQAVAHGGGNLGAAPLYNLTQNGGARTVTPSTALRVDATWSINDGTFTTNGLNHEGRGGVTVGWDADTTAATLLVTASSTFTHNVAVVSDLRVNGAGAGGGGTLQINGGGTLRFSDSSRLWILKDGQADDGALVTSGTSASSRAVISRLASYVGAENYEVVITGTAAIDYLTWQFVDANGVQIDSTSAGADAILTGWTGIRFANGTAGGRHLDLLNADSTATLPATINLCQFDAGPAVNVRGGGAAATHANVTFSSWAGALGGEQFETNDNLDLIDWGSGAAVVLRTNNPLDGDVATYATLQDAIIDATAANNVIEVRDNVIRDETLVLPDPGFRLIIDGAVLRPPGGSTAITGTGIAAREVLRNVVVIRDAASATPAIQNVANLIHCDVLGAFTTANPLITVTGGNTCLIENSIVGNPGSWQADADDPISNGGALTVNYSFVDRGAVYPGTNNANANPQLQNWDPITGGSGLYDVHLKPISTCIDYAPAPSIAVETDFDRGLDFNTPDQNPGFGNPRRPIDARPDVTDGGGPDPSWDNNFAPANTFDVGADELGPLVTGTGNKPQGVPLWTNRAGAGIVADPDSFSTPITSFTFSPAVMYVAENMNVNQAGHDIRLVAYGMNDADSDGDLDILTTLDLDASGVQKVHHISVIGAGTQDNLYLAVDLDGDADTTADAILALQYTPSPPTLALRGAWATNPRTPAGTGTIGRFVIGQSDGLLYFVRGNGRIYRHKQADGTPDGGVADPGDNWVDANGQLDLTPEGYDGKFDGEGSLYAGKFNNCIYAPTNQHANEILRIQCTDGAIAAAQTCGAGNRNHYGFNLMSQSVFVTGADQYVWRIHEDTLAFNAWPAAVWPWESEPMGANVKTTTRAQMFRIVDANVRVGAGQTVYKFRRDTGVITDDSDLAGDDWGPGRSFRGNIITAPTLIGGTGKDYTVSPDGRRCGKIVFGTDQGYCYVVGYIRATLATDVEENDEPQPASSTIVGYDVLDGRPYHGFPYRIPGVKIVSLSLLTASSVGKSVIVFITDNGWAYGFIEPY